MADFDTMFRMGLGHTNPLINVQQISGDMPNWLRAPQPVNPLQGTNLLLGQMNQMGTADRAQQGIDLQAQQLDDERARARYLANIQLQTFQAKQAQNEQARQAREDYAGQEGLTPAQRAAILAGHGGKVAAELTRSPGAPMAIIGPDGKPVYVPRSEAIGQEPYKTPMVSILPSPKLPTGYEATRDPQGNLVAKKILGVESADAAKKKAVLDKTIGSLDRMESLFRESGTEVMPGAAKTKLKTEYTNLLLELKNAKELGVLAGPDLQLMQDMLSDPTAIGASLTPNETYQAQMDQVRKILTGYSPKALPSDVPPPPAGFTERVD